jgi:hypothetical protein
VSGLSDHEGTLFAFMIGREDAGSIGGAARALLRTRQYCSAAPVSGLSDHEGTLFASMIVREDIGSTAALPARCFARARITAPRGGLAWGIR